MNRFLIIINVVIAFTSAACSSQRHHPHTISNVDKPGNRQDYRGAAAGVPGDSLISLQIENRKNLDSLLKDSSIAKILLKPRFWDSGEFVSTTYTSALPPLASDHIMDLEPAFSRNEMNIIRSNISRLKIDAKQDVVIVSFNDDWSRRDNFDRLVLAVHRTLVMQNSELANAVLVGINTRLKKVYISNAYHGIQRLTASQIKRIETDLAIGFLKEKYFEAVQDALSSLSGAIR